MTANSLTRIVIALLVVAAGLLVVAPKLAHAGGDFLDLAASSSRVWFVGAAGVREFDAKTGKELAAPQLHEAAYPDSITLAGEAAWIASVQNGDTGGALTRIDLRTKRMRIVWRRADSAVFYVAAGAGSVWALVSVRARSEIARFDLEGRLRRIWNVPGAGRMAADGYGCWISTDQWLLHIDSAGTLHRVVRAPLGDVAAGSGAVWLPDTTSILRIDEATGRIDRFSTSPLRLGGFQHDVAVGDDALWVLHQTSRSRTRLERLDTRTGRTTATTELPGIGNAIALTSSGLWIATVIAPANRSATGYDVIRLDPATIHRTLLVHIV